MTINKLERLHIFRHPNDDDVWETFQKYLKSQGKEPIKLDIYYGNLEKPIVVGERIKIHRTNAVGHVLNKTFQTLPVTDIQGVYVICALAIFKHTTKTL